MPDRDARVGNSARTTFGMGRSGGRDRNPTLSSSTLTSIRKLKGATFTNPYCDFHHYQKDHKTHDSTSIKRPGKKLALFEVDILGYPTFLCLNCLINFKQDWATALVDLARTSPNFDPVIHQSSPSSSQA